VVEPQIWTLSQKLPMRHYNSICGRGDQKNEMSKFAKYSWFVLAITIGVILWGALVRATGSGAGCGSHWPSCNGVVVPFNPTTETFIEFTHRATSGIAFLLVVGMVVWAFRNYPKGHPLRLGASMSMFFMTTEALVGASLVLFGWVGDDASLGRAISISVHLVNTFLLLAALSLTAWWASGGALFHLRGHGLVLVALAAGLLGVMVIGVTGAITALGDTLFPAGSLVEGFRQDIDPSAHFLIQLRVFHPLIAILVGFYQFFVASLIGLFSSNLVVKRFALSVIVLFFIQLVAGVVNLVLLAPIWMQLVHLFLADMVWISLVLLTASVLAGETTVAIQESRSQQIEQLTL
jgi:heme A synthase